MHRWILPVVLWMGLASISAAKTWCLCCYEPCAKECVETVPAKPESYCDDVRPAPTCRVLKPSLCRPRLANAIESDDRLAVYQSEGLRALPEIWEKTWKIEMPDIASKDQTDDSKL
jgi:hypothetical protein